MTQKKLRTWLRALPVFPDAVAPFETANLPEEPTTLFCEWLEDAAAAGQLAPHAACLSTSGADAMPSARFLILKDVDDRGWQFASHRTSPKGLDLRENPVASLTFFWPAMARQVRVSGAVAELPAEESAQDFLARPMGSRAATLVGRQSSPLADPDAYGEALDAALRELDQNPDAVDSDWTLYVLNPTRVEFWQASAGRDHTRVLYERRDAAWETARLWP